MKRRAIRIASVNHDGQPGAERAYMELHKSEDGQYRWIGRDGSDTEVSRPTVAAAVAAAYDTWHGPGWDFRVGR
jgi:hypothetical protein